MRIACVRIPDFAVGAMRRNDPSLAGSPVVVGGVPPERGNVVGVSSEARRRGLRLGMTLAQAESLFPEARFVRPDGELERQEMRAVVELLLGFTPGVEVAARDPEGAAIVFLDTRGLGRLHATEEAFGARVRQALRLRGYLETTVGIARTKLAAEVAAREAAELQTAQLPATPPAARRRSGRRGESGAGAGGAGLKSVPEGSEAAFLAPLPLAHLPFEGDLLEEVVRLGIRTIGAWAALPAESVSARFGARGLRLLALARGEDPRPLVTAPPPDGLETSVELDDAIDDLDLLTFHLKRLVDTLCGRLAARGLATSLLRARLALEDHAHVSHEARFVRPTLAPRLLVDCLRLAIARGAGAGGGAPGGSRVVGIAIEAAETAPARADQLLLFARRHAAIDPQAVEAALARVRMLVGPEGLVSPRPRDTHRPEAQVGWEPYALAAAAPARSPRRTRERRKGDPAAGGARDADRLPRVHPDAEPPPGPAVRHLPARLLASPLPAEVTVRASLLLRAGGTLDPGAGLAEHVPGREGDAVSPVPDRASRAGDEPLYVATEAVRGKVLASEGPHLLAGEWWGDAWEREYYVLTLTDGGRYWLFRERSGGWFLHGIFD